MGDVTYSHTHHKMPTITSLDTDLMQVTHARFSEPKLNVLPVHLPHRTFQNACSHSNSTSREGKCDGERGKRSEREKSVHRTHIIDRMLENYVTVCK